VAMHGGDICVAYMN